MKTFGRLFILCCLLVFLYQFIHIIPSDNSHYLAFSTLQFNQQDFLIYDQIPVHNEMITNQEIIIPKKKIYLYNTHQHETYQTGSVMDGARYLQDLLEEKGYFVIFEESDFDQYKKEHQMDLTQTYPTSRVFLQENIKTYGSFDLIIDFHRDALERQYSVFEIEGVAYAKMMMVIGNESQKREEVVQNSAILHNAVDEILKGVMRSDFSRDGATYNQDEASRILLIEIGAHLNTFDEVKRSLEILAEAIDICLKEDRFI